MRTQDGSIKSVFLFALPLIISQASFTLMQFVGRLFLSWYGTDELAASVPSGVFNFLTISFFLGVASYSNVFVAQSFGRKDFEKLTLYLWQSIFFAIGAALIILLFLPLGLYLLSFSTTNPHVLSLERSYYAIAAPAGGLGILNTAISGFFTGRGETKTTMVANFSGNIVNVIVCYFCVFGIGSLEPMGIKGTAYALIAGNLCVMIIYLSLLFSKKNREEFQITKLIRFEPRLFKRFLSFGIPSGVSFFLDISAFAAFIFVIGNLGEVALAANNIALSLESLAFLPILGIGIATSTLVGQMIGRNRHDLAILSTHSALKLNLLYTGFLGILFFFLPEFFVGFFTMKDPVGMKAITDQSIILVRILAYFIIIDAVGLTFGSAIKGAGDTRFQMLMSVLSSWIIFIPGVYLLCHVFKFSVEAAWLCSCVHLTFIGAVFYFRFRSNRWQKISLLEKTPKKEDEELTQLYPISEEPA